MIRGRYTEARRYLLAVTCTVLALNGGGWLPASYGFRHYHETQQERHAHDHLHAGAHRHDHPRTGGRRHGHLHAGAHSGDHAGTGVHRNDHRSAGAQGHTLPSHHPARPADPTPERDDEGPEGRYVPAASTAVATTVEAARSVTACESAGTVIPTPAGTLPRRIVLSTAPPRGPPA